MLSERRTYCLWKRLGLVLVVLAIASAGCAKANDTGHKSTELSRLMADYVFDEVNGVCNALNGATGASDYSGADHSAVIQAAVDAAGERGVFEFRPGTYTIRTPLRPKSFQTWTFSSGAVFEPAGDNSIMTIEDVEQLSTIGTLRIIDPQMDIDGAIFESGGIQTDETAAATDDAPNDMNLLTTDAGLGDCYYWGNDEQFNALVLDIGTAGDGLWLGVYEYWDSVDGSWREISDCRCDTYDRIASQFTRSGSCHVFFKMLPPHWGKKTILDRELYWIRFRVTGITEMKTQPKGNRAWVHRTTTKPAIYVDDMEFSQLDSIWIRGYYNAIDMNGAHGTRENTWKDIYFHVRNEGLSLETQCHDNHFLQIFGKGVSPYDFGHATGCGIRLEMTGTKGGNSFESLQLIDMDQGIHAPGATEVWFDTLLVDNARNEAVNILGGCERLFFDRIWASSSGDGLVLSGSAEDPLDDVVSINQIYARLNSNHGVYIKHNIRRINIHFISVTENGHGFHIEGPDVSEVYINTLFSFKNTAGVDSSGGTSEIFCDHADIDDSCDLSGFTSINGSVGGT